MIDAIKSELRKLLTVRTTYVLSLVGLALTLFVTTYALGYRISATEMANVHYYRDMITGALTSIPLTFGSIVAILLITHEYRYNTIMYTLTAANSRSKVLLAKVVAISLYALVFTLLIVVLAPLGAYVGVHLKGAHLVAQTMPHIDLLWFSLYYGWTSLIAALVIGVIARSQVGAIVALFVIPTIEVLLTGLLKAKAVYLPFTGASNAILQDNKSLSHLHAALIFGGYLLVAWIVAWVLFVRRDAN